MPLDLKPLLDLTPLDEEESTQLERGSADFVEPPPMPSTGATGEWLDATTLPARSSEELGAKNFYERQALNMGPEGQAETIGELAMNPLVKLPTATSQIAQDALDMLQASAMRLGAPRPSMEIEQAAKELESGPQQPPTEFAKGVAGTVNVAKTIPETFTSPVGAASLGMGALPAMGQRAVSAAFLADMASHTPEAAERAGAASVGGDLQEKIEAYGGLATLPVFASAVGLHAARPAIPAQFVETMRRVDAVVPDALPRTKEAAIKKVANNAAIIEVEAKVEPVKAAEPAAPAPVEAKMDTLAADIAREQTIAAEKKALLESEDVMTLGENPKWMELSKEFEAIKNKYQGRKPSDVQAEQVQPKPTETLTKGGNKITPETQPERISVQAEQVLENGETMPGYVTIQSKGNAQSGPVEAWRAAGHEIPDTAGLPSGTYTVAELAARTKPAQPAPVTTPEVAAKPSLFREASAQDVDSYVNPGTSATTPYVTPEIYASTSRDLALGQGKNKTGIVVEFDPANLDVREPKIQKPGSAFVEQQGGGAEKFIRAQPHQLRDKVKSITVPKSLGHSAKDPYAIRLRRHLDQNWSAEAVGDTIVYRPKQAIEPTRAAAFFERESEAAGLGRSSLPPTVEDVRAQRARDAAQAEPVGLTPEQSRGLATPDIDTIAESTPLDPQSGAPVPSRVKPPGTPPPTVPPKPGAAAAPEPGRATLDDVYKIFETPPKEGKGISQRVGEAVESFRTGFSSKFRPLNKLAEDVAAKVGGKAKDIAGIFEQLKGSSGKAEADVYRFDKDVSDVVKGSEKDFNAYVFLRRSLDRLKQDATDIQRAQAGENVSNLNRRRVSQYTIPQLEAKLNALSEQIGGEKLAQFNKAAESFQTHMDQALRLQVESGRMAPEVYDAIKAGNQFYAPFKVMKYIEETVKPEGSGRKVDTVADFTKAMEGIDDPNVKLGDMLAAARQNLTLSRTLAEKNRAMQNITELAALDVDGNFVQKLKPGAEAPKGMEPVNVLENGVSERYAVNPDVAQAIQNAGPGLPAGIVARWSSNLFRAGATTLNVAFQPVNLLFADAPRAALVSKYGVKGVTDLVRYPMDFVESLFSSISADMFGVKNKLFQDFLDSGAAGTTVQQYLTPDALRFKPETATSKSMAVAKTVLNTIPQFANAIEQTSKVLGVKRAMRIEGTESGAALAKQIPEAITEIRRFSGSPDFGRSGKWVEQYRLNLVYMFLNARIQGAVADVGRLTGRDGGSRAAKTWLKMGTAVGIPTAYLYILNNSDEYKEDYAKRPAQEKQNYWLIPKDTFITGSNGEKMRDYWRVPKREIAQWMGNAVESGLDFANERDPDAFWKWAGGMAESIAPLNIKGDTLQERAESVVSGTHPFIKAPIEAATGRDLYRHRAIVPDSQKKASPEQQFTDRTPEVFKSLADAMPDVAPEVFRSPLMLENVTKNFTAGLLTQFLPRQPVEGRSKAENLPLTQRFQAVPYTDSSEFDQRIQKFERESADEQLSRMRDAKAIMDTNKGAKPDVLIQDMIKKHGRDEKMAERIIDLYVADQRGITTQERRVLALPVTQRAEYLADELKGKTPEQKAALLRNWALKRILTERVGAELAPLITP